MGGFHAYSNISVILIQLQNSWHKKFSSWQASAKNDIDK